MMNENFDTDYIGFYSRPQNAEVTDFTDAT